MYSLLSNYAHLQPDLQAQYIDFSQEYARVVFLDCANCLGMGVHLAVLAREFAVVSEYISHDYYKEAKIWMRGTDGRLVRTARYDYAEQLESILQQFSGSDA